MTAAFSDLIIKQNEVLLKSLKPEPKPVPKPVPEVVTSLVEDQYGYAVQKEVKLAEVPEKTDGRKSGKSDSNEDGFIISFFFGHCYVTIENYYNGKR